MLKIEDTAFVLVDVQGKLAEIVHESEAVLANLEKLIKGLKILEVPIVMLEQYPEGLGTTNGQLKQHLSDVKLIEKITFSACKNECFVQEIERIGRKKMIVAGIEAHVCVYQTVRELISLGYEVEIIVDAVSSRTKQNREIGIEKMKLLGASIASVEMVLFELMETAKHPRFKEVIELIK